MTVQLKHCCSPQRNHLHDLIPALMQISAAAVCLQHPAAGHSSVSRGLQCCEACRHHWHISCLLWQQAHRQDQAWNSHCPHRHLLVHRSHKEDQGTAKVKPTFHWYFGQVDRWPCQGLSTMQQLGNTLCTTKFDDFHWHAGLVQCLRD